MLAQTLLDSLTRDPSEPGRLPKRQPAELAKRIVEGLNRTQLDVRRICKGLVPLSLDSPQALSDALRELAARTNDLEGITCTFRSDSPVAVTDDFTASHLYRIAQESLNNALRHGKPKHIVISLEGETGQLVLNVADDGVGFQPNHANKGLGLKAMHYRASLIGATLSVGPSDTGGVSVSCKVLGVRRAAHGCASEDSDRR